MHSLPHSLAWWPAVALLAIATVTDLAWRRIPNWLTGPFLVAGIAVSGWLHGWRGVAQSGEGIGLGLLLYGILFWLGGMGAGDVKLCAAIGAWIGPGQLFLAMIFAALAGGLMALAWAAAGGFSSQLLDETGNLVLGWWKRDSREAEAQAEPPAHARRKMPYAPAIALGTLISFFAR